ncbi:MAG: hypothetical protein VKP62_01970 [Candidatus Sericytochromatia bacterium]|nr:hypothetical protein [Candidatus Sericytochromatia bacterium]
MLAPESSTRSVVTSATVDSSRRTARLAAEGAADWMFLFRLPGAGAPRFVSVTVDCAGSLEASVAEMPSGQQGFAFEPARIVPAAQAVAAATADGLPGETFWVELAPADGLFFGAQQTPYVGPLTFLVGTERFREHRLVSARSGLLRRGPDEAELARARTLMTPLLVRWHQTLTHGERRPVTSADLVAAGMVPQGAASWIRMNDADRDGVVTQDELVGTFTTPTFLRAWREAVIMGELWRADTDRDERLSPAEARPGVAPGAGPPPPC